MPFRCGQVCGARQGFFNNLSQSLPSKPLSTTARGACLQQMSDHDTREA